MRVDLEKLVVENAVDCASRTAGRRVTQRRPMRQVLGSEGDHVTQQIELSTAPYPALD